MIVKHELQPSVDLSTGVAYSTRNTIFALFRFTREIEPQSRKERRDLLCYLSLCALHVSAVKLISANIVKESNCGQTQKTQPQYAGSGFARTGAREKV